VLMKWRPRKENSMQGVTALLFELFIMYAAARLAAELFERLDQPAVIGELLAGIVIGPHLLGWIGRPDSELLALFHDEEPARLALLLVNNVFAQVGAIVLLFYVGLETRVSDLL